MLDSGQCACVLVVCGLAPDPTTRIKGGLDFIKLPTGACTSSRGRSTDLAVIRLNLLLCTTRDFEPDALVISPAVNTVAVEIGALLGALGHQAPQVLYVDGAHFQATGAMCEYARGPDVRVDEVPVPSIGTFAVEAPTQGTVRGRES